MRHGETHAIEVVYDGQCPFCAAYLRLLRLRDLFPAVGLIDARQNPDIVLRLARQGHDLNSGMALFIDGRAYFGADAIHAIALMSSRSGLFNRANRRVLGSRRLAAFVYPLLRTGRAMTLFLLRRPPIGVHPSAIPIKPRE